MHAEDCLEPMSVLVLAGGVSPEKLISHTSGIQAAAALESLGHAVAIVDPAETSLDDINWSWFDVCFIALHGGEGEDGRIQRQLEQRGVAYTGSRPTASRLAMSKSAAKERFFQTGVPTLPYALFHATDAPEQIATHVARVGYPAVIKPDSQGSSIGLGLCQSAAELQRYVAASAAFDPFIMAEMYLAGREFTVAVLDRRPLPLLEIVIPAPLFTYDAKYNDEPAEVRLESGLSPDKRAQLEQTAVAAAASLETAGLARVDLLLDETGGPWVLEVNTVPGLTPTSLAPRAAAAAGMDLAALCDWMVREALRVGVAG